MLTSAYALSTEYNETNLAADPENRLLWRANRRRLDIESIRDSLLFVAGDLDLKAGGPAVEFGPTITAAPSMATSAAAASTLSSRSLISPTPSPPANSACPPSSRCKNSSS